MVDVKLSEKLKKQNKTKTVHTNASVFLIIYIKI